MFNARRRVGDAQMECVFKVVVTASCLEFFWAFNLYVGSLLYKLSTNSLIAMSSNSHGCKILTGKM